MPGIQEADGFVEVRHAPTGATATFDLDGSQLDGLPVWEVWQDDTYRLSSMHVESGVVIDVGAHVGAFSVLAAKAGAKKVVAYEPSGAYDRLVVNVERNRVQRIVEHHNLAVAADTGWQGFLDGAGGSSHSAARDELSRLVGAVSLDDVVARFPHVALIKIDCEGCEWDVLEAFDDVMLDKVGRIVMEWHVRSDGMPWVDVGAQTRLGGIVLWLLEHGQVRVYGRPSRGGLLWWEHY